MKRLEAAKILWVAGVPLRWIETDLRIGKTTLYKADLQQRDRLQTDCHGDKALDRLVELAAKGLAA